MKIKDIIQKWKDTAERYKEFMIWFSRKNMVRGGSYTRLLFKRWKTPLKYIPMICLWPIEWILTIIFIGISLMLGVWWFTFPIMIIISPFIMLIGMAEFSFLLRILGILVGVIGVTAMYIIYWLAFELYIKLFSIIEKAREKLER